MEAILIVAAGFAVVGMLVIMVVGLSSTPPAVLPKLGLCGQCASRGICRQEPTPACEQYARAA